MQSRIDIEVSSNASLFKLWPYFVLQVVPVTLEIKHIMKQKVNCFVQGGENMTVLLSCIGCTVAGGSLVSSTSWTVFISMANIFLCAKLKSYMLLFCKGLIYW